MRAAPASLPPGRRPVILRAMDLLPRRARPGLGVLAFLLLSACGRPGDTRGEDLWQRSTIHRARKAGKLVVLMEAEFRPFTWKDAGTLRGFDVDLAREIGAALGVPVEFRERAFQLLASELIEGRGDLVISGVTATPERALECSFSDPYFLTRTIALLAVPRAAGVRGAADLDDAARTVVVQKGSTGETATRRRLPRAHLVTLDTESLCALEVAQGRADAFVYDEYQVRAHHAQHLEATRVLDETLSVEPYGIECRKGEPDTLAWLNLVVATMRRDGRIADLYRKHLPGIPVPAELAPP